MSSDTQNEIEKKGDSKTALGEDSFWTKPSARAGGTSTSAKNI